MDEQKLFEKTCVVLGKDSNKYNADLHLVDLDEIAALNKQHRGKDSATDVLAFPLDTFNPETKKTELGDIVICLEYKSQFAPEYLYVHGLLHLFGYTHDTEDDLQKMHDLTTLVL